LSMKKRCILGIGNRLKQDDAAGSILAERLADKGMLSLDGGSTPENYSGVIKKENPDILIIIDVTAMSLKPGEFRRIPVEKISTDCEMNTHSLSPAYLMDYLAEHVGKIIFIGIEPAVLDFGEELSPEIQVAINEIEEIILQGKEMNIVEI